MKVLKGSPSSKLGIDDGIIQVTRVDYNPPVSEGDEYVEVDTQPAVRCHTCGKIHLVDPPVLEKGDPIRFFTIEGNLHANYRGGILGNASWDKYGIPTFHYCKNCFVSYIKGLE